MDREKFDLMPDDAVLRLEEVLAVVGVSRSTWYLGVKAGRFPQPAAQPARQRPVVWRVRDIRALLGG